MLSKAEHFITFNNQQIKLKVYKPSTGQKVSTVRLVTQCTIIALEIPLDCSISMVYHKKYLFLFMVHLYKKKKTKSRKADTGVVPFQRYTFEPKWLILVPKTYKRYLEVQ